MFPSLPSAPDTAALTGRDPLQPAAVAAACPNDPTYGAADSQRGGRAGLRASLLLSRCKIVYGMVTRRGCRQGSAIRSINSSIAVSASRALSKLTVVSGGTAYR